MVKQPESLLVTPSPGFVVKTRGTRNGEKFFLNILGSEHVEAPHMKSLLEADGQKGIRIPISVGERVEERDKSGEPCECVDLVISSKSISEAEADVEFKQMVCQIAIQAVSQKYKLELEPRFTLPRLKYKGATVRAQRIRIKKESQIEEITESSVISTDRILPPFTITYFDNTGNQIDGLLLPCYQTVSDEITRNLREKVFGNVSESTTDLRESLKDNTCHVSVCILQHSLSLRSQSPLKV